VFINLINNSLYWVSLGQKREIQIGVVGDDIVVGPAIHRGDRHPPLGRGDGSSLTTTERDELNRLRRENRQLRLEREILSKAAAWFARETNAIPAKGSGS
jgi:hypothetical protein